MHRKKIARILIPVLAAGILTLGGCGNADRTAQTSSAQTESSASAEAESSAAKENSNSAAKEESSTSNENSSKIDPKDYASQVPETKNAVKDTSYSMRKASKKGSLEKFDGKYRLYGAIGNYYYFDGKKTAYYVLSGDYKFTEDSEEQDAVSLQFKTAQTATVYTVTLDGDTTSLKGINASGDTTTNLDCTLLKGTDGIRKRKPFEGIYSVGGRDDYRLEFHSDGTFYMIIDQTYSVSGKKLKLTAINNSFTYDYSVKDGKYVLSSDGKTISELLPGA